MFAASSSYPFAHRLPKGVFLLVFLAMLWGGPAHAVLVTVTATGTAGSFKTGSVDAAGTKNDGDMVNLSSVDNRGWATFNLSGIPAGAIINSVTANFTTFTSTSSATLNYLGGFSGDPALLPGATLYALLNADATTNFNASAWNTSPALNSTGFNTTGKLFISANAGSASVVISYVRSAANLFNISGYGAAAGSQPSLVIDYTPPIPCSGTPAPGATLATVTSVCPGQAVTFALSGIFPGTGGLAYQWQASTNGSTFANIPGATAGVYASMFTANTWIRCVVTCASSGQSGTSTAAAIAMNSVTTCYCTSGATNTGDDDIGQVSFGPLVSPASAPSPLFYNSSATATYTNNTALPALTFFSGFTYPITIQQFNQNNFYGCYAKVFIDYNQNGSLTDPGEEIFGGQTTNSSGNGADPLMGSILIPLTATSGQTLMRVVLEENGSDSTTVPCNSFPFGETEDYLINIIHPVPCTGATAGNTAATDSMVCATQGFTLSLPNTVQALNIAYQWQSSPDNTTWTNIPGANSVVFSTTQSVNTWYRCTVTCTTASATDISIPVQVQMNSFLSCYCTSTATTSYDEEILDVTINFASNPSACSSLAPGPGSVVNQYSNYTSLPPVACFIGSMIPFSVQVGGCGNAYTNAIAIFIDYNQNGNLSDPGENVYLMPSSIYGSYTETGTLQIPVSALPGVTLMRVVNVQTFSPSNITPCLSYGYGETEDYLLNLIVPTPCVGAVAGNTAATDSSVCVGQNFTLSMPNTVVNSNLAYQWQSSADSLVWANVAGATNMFFGINQIDTTFYRCIVQCTTSLAADTSDALKVSMAPFLDCYCASAATATWGTDIGQFVLGGYANPAVAPPLNGPDVDFYTNFTSLGALQLYQGGLLPVSVSQVSPFGTSSVVSVYIDLDHNGTYDFTEEVFSGNSAISNPMTGSMLIPATAQLGLTGMRVILQDWGFTPLDPCALYSTGETEDYLVNIVPPIPQNGQLVAIYSPGTGCGLTNCEDLSFDVRNAGADSIFTLGYTYILNNGTPVAATFALVVPAAPGDIISVVVPCALNLSTPGNYSLKVYVQVAGDTDPMLDTLVKTIVSIPLISTFPYIQGFDNPAFPTGGWTSAAMPGSPGNTWQLGTPAKAVINSPASAPNSWITNLTANYLSNEVSYVESPCFDFTAIAQPIVEIKVWWECETNWAGVVLQSSTDGGLTWSNVGTPGTGQNWYTSAVAFALQMGYGTSDAWSGAGSDGSGGWVKAIHPLTGLGFESSVKLRVAYASGWSAYDGFAFDDVKIYDTPLNDVGTYAVTAPMSGDCGDDSTAVMVIIKNTGVNAQINFPITVTYTNGAGSQGTITTTYSATLPANATDTAFVGTFNSLGGGTYTIKAYTGLSTDGLHLNDTTLTQVYLNAIPASPPATNDFKCTADNFALSVTNPDPALVYTWFDAISGGNALGSGPNYQTPLVTQTTTYYVAAQGNAMFDLNTPVSGGMGTTWFGYTSEGLEFSNAFPMTLDSVTIYPTGGGLVQLIVVDPFTNVVIDSGVVTNIFYNGGPVRIPVDIELPVAGIYYLKAATTSTIPDLQYSWSGANFPYAVAGVSIDGNTDGTGAFGQYYFYYDWAVTTLGCPSERTPVVAGIYPTPVVTLGPDYSACGGNTLNAGNGWANISWTYGSTVVGNGQTLFAGSSGIYGVTVTDLNGCLGGDQINVQVNAAPTVSLGNDTTACGLLVLDAGNPGASFAWGCSAVPAFGQTLMVAQSGTYCVTVTNPFGCQTSDSVVATITPTPQVNLGNDFQTCVPATLGMVAPVPNSTCSWALPGGGSSSNCTITASVTGTYVLTVTDAAGCAGSDDVKVTVKIPPTVNIGGGAIDTVCSSKVLNAGNPGSSYLWIMPTGSTTTQSVTAATTGKYKVVVTNNIGCAATDSAFVVINAKPANLSYTTGYTGQPFEYIFTASNTAGVGVVYTWAIASVGGTVQTYTGSSITVLFPATPDFYEVKVTATNECGSVSITEVLMVNGVADGFAAGVSVYPNPTDGIAWLTFTGLSQAVQLTVYDANGRALIRRSVRPDEQHEALKLDLSELAKGTYLLRFDTETGTATRKITVN